MKTEQNPPASDALPSFMKGFVAFLLLMIPVLGYFILRSDPIVYSNNVEKNETTVKQVREFAAFIEKKPEMVRGANAQSKGVAVRPSSAAVLATTSTSEALEDARERVRELAEIWRNAPPKFDSLWRNQVDRVLDSAERTGSEDALDLAQSQILSARVHSDDLNRAKADQWIERYLKIEKRESKLREMSDFYKEKVLERLDEDERKARESN